MGIFKIWEFECVKLSYSKKLLLQYINLRGFKWNPIWNLSLSEKWKNIFENETDINILWNPIWKWQNQCWRLKKISDEGEKFTLHHHLSSYLRAPEGHLSMISAISDAGACETSTHGLLETSNTLELPLRHSAACTHKSGFQNTIISSFSYALYPWFIKSSLTDMLSPQHLTPNDRLVKLILYLHGYILWCWWNHGEDLKINLNEIVFDKIKKVMLSVMFNWIGIYINDSVIEMSMQLTGSYILIWFKVFKYV